MRLTQGGHDVPTEKLHQRFSRTISNLKAAVRVLPLVFIYDNSDLAVPFRRLAVIEDGVVLESVRPLPEWLQGVLT